MSFSWKSNRPEDDLEGVYPEQVFPYALHDLNGHQGRIDERCDIGDTLVDSSTGLEEVIEESTRHVPYCWLIDGILAQSFSPWSHKCSGVKRKIASWGKELDEGKIYFTVYGIWQDKYLVEIYVARIWIMPYRFKYSVNPERLQRAPPVRIQFWFWSHGAIILSSHLLLYVLNFNNFTMPEPWSGCFIELISPIS